MDESEMAIDGSLSFARSYQLEALEKAIKQNTIVFLETGSGKTLIAIMLLRSYAHLLRKPSPYIAVFLVPAVVLVDQQATVITKHTDLKVGMYWGEMGVDFWDAATWDRERENNEVLVMTPQILLDSLRHSFFKLDMIKVLIFDECHHAKGRHPYACIMTEFYHRQLRDKATRLPRIFGMTASPVKTKGFSSGSTCWRDIQLLENMMHSKVYTCYSDSVLAQYIPFSTPKIKTYKQVEIPYTMFARLAEKMAALKYEHESSLQNSELNGSVVESAKKRVSKLYSTFLFCLDELGVWLALKAAEFISRDETDIFSWGVLDVCCERIVRDFSHAAVGIFASALPSEHGWRIGNNVQSNVAAGFLTSKVLCLIESLTEYRNLKDLRCIVFVERVVTAIVLHMLLSELLPELCGWNTNYMAGNNAGLQTQSRKQQNNIVDQFRRGLINVIIATSILEEGLDVQSCNLVIRFDLSTTVCSFFQSRGRARMQNSDYLIMVRSGDSATLSRLNSYLASGDVMRAESLRHASLPCDPLENDLHYEDFYSVESTDAIVTLSSSIGLIYFYCSRLPSDGYFKPAPRFIYDELSGSVTLILPKSCALPSICVEGNIRLPKKSACLEACKQLHAIGALTDNLVPAIVAEETDAQELRNIVYDDQKPMYYPPELFGHGPHDSDKMFYCYLIELKKKFEYDIPVHNIMFLVEHELGGDFLNMDFDLESDRGNLSVHMTYFGYIVLCPEQVLLFRRFQLSIFSTLMDHNFNKVQEMLSTLHPTSGCPKVDYFLLPSSISDPQRLIDWQCVKSVAFSCESMLNGHTSCSHKGYARNVQTKNGLVCSCVLKNSLVVTPHNDHLYSVTGILDNLNGNSFLHLSGGGAITYKEYYKSKHGVDLCFGHEKLFCARKIFSVQNCLQNCRQQKGKVSSDPYVELPPELCLIIMSPISIDTFYTFSFVPSMMHRIESFLIAANLKKLYVDDCTQNISIPTNKVLEAITTKKCQEKFHLESLETLGDSFLKFSVSQQLFKEYQNHDEGRLSCKKDKIISNAALCRIGCERKLPGFIRNEPFDPKTWIIPGDQSINIISDEDINSTSKLYLVKKRKVKSKTVADVVEALIGAFLCTGGEAAALQFMGWLGIKVALVGIPYQIQTIDAHKYANIASLEATLSYRFNNPSLLVEALTHGSYMMLESPRCYQRLEYLGDAVLDYLVTMHLYHSYPGMTPGLITDLRSCSVNNDCYAQSAVRAKLHRHIIHASMELNRQISSTVDHFMQSSLETTFGWETETPYPKALGDIIESLAGAIFVDSGYNKESVFASIRPLLEPLVTPETVKLHPLKELNELCQKEHFQLNKIKSHENDVSFLTIEVEANGVLHQHKTSSTADKKTAKKVASKYVLQSLKESISRL